jgi:hypothetical protein
MPETAETLFRTYFLPLYPAGTKTDLAALRRTDENPANNPTILAHLREAAEVFVRMAPGLLGEGLDRTDASVHRLSRALTRARRDAWAGRGAPGTSVNELFNVVVHGAAYLGECIVRGHGGSWAVRRPLWESVVKLSSRAGEAELAVFHWWLKSLADDALGGGAGGGLADRYRAHVEIPCARPEGLPRLATPDRAVPRLAKVRYDTLFKHLKAHLPELRDLGEHFPTPERFDQYRFTWLDFALLGEGRLLLIHGPGEGGVHLFWLDTAGFQKSVLVPADAFPAHVLRVEGEKIVLVVAVAGEPRAHEMLWWGP